ncbi:hypothetical protein [Allomeiothermus silvanus]|uniref:hypothetical protein n=1 Tax=Allomeiothermus silvanus TaxID=52022 RepID=UPI00145C8B3B|nr:hypothetical protein [Allomeiothermus silvanus]
MRRIFAERSEGWRIFAERSEGWRIFAERSETLLSPPIGGVAGWGGWRSMPRV